MSQEIQSHLVYGYLRPIQNAMYISHQLNTPTVLIELIQTYFHYLYYPNLFWLEINDNNCDSVVMSFQAASKCTNNYDCAPCKRILFMLNLTLFLTNDTVSNFMCKLEGYSHFNLSKDFRHLQIYHSKKQSSRHKTRNNKKEDIDYSDTEYLLQHIHNSLSKYDIYESVKCYGFLLDSLSQQVIRGAVRADRFRFEREIADTLQGRVYLGTDFSTNKPVVIKEAWRQLVHSGRCRKGRRVAENFFKERELIMTLTHLPDSIIRGIGKWEDEHCYYYAMEYGENIQLFDQRYGCFLSDSLPQQERISYGDLSITLLGETGSGKSIFCNRFLGKYGGNVLCKERNQKCLFKFKQQRRKSRQRYISCNFKQEKKLSKNKLYRAKRYSYHRW